MNSVYDSSPPETPYKGVRPYCEEDAAYFFGRDAEIELVCEVLRAARLSVIFGPRGVGKTSLLHAGVAPHLRHTAAQSEKVIVFDCAPENPIPRFGAALRSASRERVPNFLSLDTVIKTIGRDERLLILLDQFEECVTRHEAFTAELMRRMSVPDLPLHFLLVARDEVELALQPLLARLPNLFDGMLRLRPLADDAARAAIVGPIEVFNLKNPGLEMHIEPEAIEAILAAAKDGAANQIDTGKLQRILAALWDYEFSSGVATLRQATVSLLVAQDDAPPAKDGEIIDDVWPSTMLTPAQALPIMPPRAEAPPEVRARKRFFAYAALAAFALVAAAFFALNNDRDAQITLRESTIPIPITVDPPVAPPSVSPPEVRSSAKPETAPPVQTPEIAQPREFEEPLAPPMRDSKRPVTPSSAAPAPMAREPRVAARKSSPPAAEVPAPERLSPSDAKSPAVAPEVPRVFIHVREKSSATSALIKELEDNGIAVSGVKEVDRGPRSIDLRYFHPREKQEANKIAQRLKQLDIQIAQVKYISGYEEAAPDRQYELWFPLPEDRKQTTKNQRTDD